VEAYREIMQACEEASLMGLPEPGVVLWEGERTVELVGHEELYGRDVLGSERVVRTIM
jgi:hypothetical protein